MSQLNDLIREAAQEHKGADGRYDLAAIRDAVMPKLSGKTRYKLARQAVLQRIKSIVTKAVASALSAAEMAKREYEEPDLFPLLQSAYEIDEKTAKDTDDLSQLEFARVIQIREEQLLKDNQKLDLLRVAFAAAYPIWAEHPDWTFGQCKAELKRRNRKGRGKSKK